MRLRLASLPVPGCLLLAACATPPPPIGVDSALFPSADGPTCTARAAGPPRLAVDPQSRDLISEAQQHQRIRVGQILTQALLLMLGPCWKDVAGPAMAPSAAAGGGGSTLWISNLKFEQRGRLLWLVPLPVPLLLQPAGQRQVDLQLSFDVSLLDARGRVVLTRSYRDDLGHVVYGFPLTDQANLDRQIQQRVHEAAWRLASRVRDQRDWNDARPLDEREP